MNKKRSPTFFSFFKRAPKRYKAALAIVMSCATGSGGVLAQGPAGGTVRAGDARISGQGTSSTRIDQSSERAIIDWRSFTIGAADEVIFRQPSSQSATLNRVTGEQVSVILGKLDANGTLLLINPNGVVFGGGAQVNVGSLIASTSNISDAKFMAGQLVFDQPGRVGAGILNAGALTARDGGLVALVAPHVRNDGVIVARLGKVMLGAADTFTVDLYGDALVNLALSDRHAGQLVGLNGEPVTSLVTNQGRIDAAGGQAVLITARNAKNVLDNLVNMSGTIKADSAVQQGGRILLLGDGGTVDVNGTLSSRGAAGGSIEVLGDRVRLGDAAALDAGGTTVGGIVHVGGAFQGQGDTYRAATTSVAAGATLTANALERGNGGEVVVWSDGRTQFAGTVQARGGAHGGDGGRLEVSGKGTLDFLGQADASAAAGTAGTLLLDPETLSIGANEAGAINRVLRTGTTTNLLADVDINVDSPLLGGDRNTGGGLNITAGNNINVNDFIVTNDGAINLTATGGTVRVAPDKAVFAGSAPITVTAGGDVSTGPMLTSGALSVRSIAGAVAIDSFIDELTGPVSIRAARNVDINQPIVSMASGHALTITAGTDVNVNAQVDGRGGVEGGTVSITAERDLNGNQAIVTNNGDVSLTAVTGAMAVTAPLVSGTGALALSARGNVATGPMSAGSLAVASTAGSVGVNGIIDAVSGDARVAAALDVNLGAPILNGQSGGLLEVTAGRDINVTDVIDGRGGVAGGAVTLTAARHLNINDYVLTHDGAINFTAATGALVAGKGTFSGTGAISMRSAADLTTTVISGGSLSATSTAGSVRVNGVIDGATGKVDLTAATDVRIDSAVGNGRSGASFTATAGRDVIVNAMIDGRGGATNGAVAVNAGRDVAVNSSIVTNSGAIGLTAATGAITMASGTAIVSGASPIAMTAAGNIRTQGISGGSLSARSTAGSINVDGIVDGNTGRVDLAAARDVNINAPMLNTRTGAPLTATAGGNINVNAQIDGTAGIAGGAVNLIASGDLNVNAPIATNNGDIHLSATNGAATIVPLAGLYAGVAPISLDALGNVTTSTLSGGGMNIESRGGSVFVTGQISGVGGGMTIAAAGKVDISHAITNLGASSPLSITAGTDIDVSAAVGRTTAGVPSGSVALTAGQNVHLNDSIVTQDGAISVTATSGTISTAAGEGLFAGSGAIFVQSRQTLSTMPTVTTGTLTMRSTGGSVNVDTAINGSTGAVTIDAANDVNINSAIANPRENAPLTVTAGHDINVKVAIDGRDSDPGVKSGSVTFNAGNNIALDKSIVSEDAAISVTARDGTVTTATGEGLFAGSGAIAVTTGAALDTGITSTTGSLTLRSTGGAVNVNQPIDDTTGAVSISAGTAVNINQAITNLKSGSNLVVTAGTDINVLAGVDGRSGALAGGAVTMTAGNGITVVSPIASNDGAIALTATAGSIVLPVGTEVLDGNVAQPQIVTPMQASIIAGSAPVTLTSGGNFTLSSPVKTTGALTLVTTSGNLVIAAPVDDTTGVVTISAGNGLVVNREINSDNQDITLNAGAGGIVINQIVDYDYRQISSVNPNQANLTLRSVGDISILDGDGVASGRDLTIDTRGQITTGIVGPANITGINDRPQNLFLNADGGIVTFTTGFASNIEATSSGGSISLIVADPDRLRITTGTPGTLDCATCDITLISNHFDGSIGPDVVLNAGGSVTLPNEFRTVTADFTARSGDVNLGQLALVNDRFTGTAGRDINLGGLLWLDGGPLTLTAGRDITGPAAGIHVSNSQLSTFIANRHLTLFTLETLGGVSLTSTTGNITLNTDIGGHIVNTTLAPDFNPGDLGVASFTMSAPAATAVITMQGARAEGNVTISTGGTLTAAKQITSVHGSVSIFAAGGATLSAVPIGNVNQLILPGSASPVSAPGPRQPIPTPPGLLGNGAPGAPAFAEIGVSTADQIVGGIAPPGGANGSVAVGQFSTAANAPGRTSSVNGQPGSSTGVSPAQPIDSTDQAGADTADALRAAGEKCDQGSSSDNGLAAAAPGSDSAAAPGQSNGSCAAAAPGGAAGAPAPTGSSAPAKPAPSATPSKQGAGSQRRN